MNEFQGKKLTSVEAFIKEKGIAENEQSGKYVFTLFEMSVWLINER